MAQPLWLKKYLIMKPEVKKIYSDLEDYLNFCRMELLPFNPGDMYNNKNNTWKQYTKEQSKRRR